MQILSHSRPAVALALATAALLLPASTLSADAARSGIDEGDHVLFHVTIRGEEGEILYTSDADLAKAEIEQGNPHLVHPDEAPAMTYRPRGGFLQLTHDNDTRFDHVPFLLGRHQGDPVLTPLMASPFQAGADVTLPRVVHNVHTSFPVRHEELAQHTAGTNASPQAFRYAGDFPATATPLNETHALVTVNLEPGSILQSETFGFPFRVERVNASAATLAPQLAVGDVFHTKPCGLALGLAPGRYRVAALNETTITLASHTPHDILANRLVSFEFTILEVQDWPEIYRSKALLEYHAKRIGRSLTAAAAHFP